MTPSGTDTDPTPLERVRRHREALRDLAARLAEEYAGVATPGRVVAATHRADRVHRLAADDRLGAVERRVRARLDDLVDRRRAGAADPRRGSRLAGDRAPFRWDLLPSVSDPGPLVPPGRRTSLGR